MVEKLLYKGVCTIQKMDMKGGWTFVVFESNIPKTGLPFGWLIVKGTIDDFEIKQFKLWPTKDGKLFLPLKTAIRKKIKKGNEDQVNIVLYLDDSEVEIPFEFIECISESPKALSFFNTISNTSKKQYIDWVYSSKTIETRANRFAKAIQKMEMGLKYHQKL